MGSWEETCAATNLPIRPGDKCRIIFICRSNMEDWWAGNKGGPHSYSTEMWKPISHALKAKYDDYGRFVFSTSDFERNMLESILRDSIVEMPLGENEYHDIAVTKEGFTLESAMEAIGEDRLFIGVEKANATYDKKGKSTGFTYTRENAPVGSIAIHEFAYKSIIKCGSTNEGHEEQANEEKLVSLFMTNLKDEVSLAPTVARSSRTCRPWDDRISAVLNHVDIGGRCGLTPYNEFLSNAVTKQENAVSLIAHELANFYYFQYGWGCLRKHFVPQSGSGSQATYYKGHEHLFNAAAKFAKKCQHEYDE